MIAHGQHEDVSTVCAQGIHAAKHKGKSGSSTPETPHVLVEKQNKPRHTRYSALTSLLFGWPYYVQLCRKQCTELWKRMVWWHDDDDDDRTKVYTQNNLLSKLAKYNGKTNASTSTHPWPNILLHATYCMLISMENSHSPIDTILHLLCTVMV